MPCAYPAFLLKIVPSSAINARFLKKQYDLLYSIEAVRVFEILIANDIPYLFQNSKAFFFRIPAISNVSTIAFLKPSLVKALPINSQIKSIYSILLRYGDYIPLMNKIITPIIIIVNRGVIK